ncbi:hypothetical protein CB0940_07126 [Cercospora beticola]|uniref:Uncharacterized protein n=1 Tax=Cercospora beticola TaxID=122368 RepID=A0A2G5HAC6_CERBT|nr:hypothetical protein CB0940_07126 [Cercospora beticola]PIA89471.1 hypothetical protein CB0940_07126 [Cercospora beticola]WPB03051.1 hypothetical protein RHO25_007688 [Cercospora beticola]
MAASDQLPERDTYNARSAPHPEPPAFADTAPHGQLPTSMQNHAPATPYFYTQSATPSHSFHTPVSQDYGQNFQYRTFVGPDVPFQWYTESVGMNQSAWQAQGPECTTTPFDFSAPIAPAAAGVSDTYSYRTTAEQLRGNRPGTFDRMAFAQVPGELDQNPAAPGQHIGHPLAAGPSQYDAWPSQPMWPSTPSTPQNHMDTSVPGSSHTRPGTSGRRKTRQPVARPAPLVTPSPLRSKRSQASQDSMVRRVAPKSRLRGAKNMSKLVTHLGSADAHALIDAKKSIAIAADKRYVDQFQSKQEALDHLSRITGNLQYHQLSAQVQIKTGDIDSQSRRAIRQYFLDAIREAPDRNELPHYFADEHEKQNYVRKNHEQYQQCLQKLENLTDSSACVFLLLQVLIDVYDEDKGIPKSDLDSGLRTSRGNHKLEIDITFYQKVALIGDILKKYKWVGKDVLNNNNILLIVVATETFLRTKLNNCDSNATRQDWKDEEMESKGVTKPKLKAKTVRPSGSHNPNATLPVSQDGPASGLSTIPSV